MIRYIVGAAIALASVAAVPASAKTIELFGQAGARGVDFTEAEFKVDSALGAVAGPLINERYVTLTGQVNSVLGQSVGYRPPIGYAFSQPDGTQQVFLTDRFYSSFFPTADFDATANLIFKGPAGSLFQGDTLLVDTLAQYFVSGSLNYKPNTVIALALPEAGTWAMMVFGLGAIGTAIRSGRRRAAGRRISVA